MLDCGLFCNDHAKDFFKVQCRDFSYGTAWGFFGGSNIGAFLRVVCAPPPHPPTIILVDIICLNGVKIHFLH